MIYYPLTTLMLAGIRDILVITTRSRARFEALLGDGSRWGSRSPMPSSPAPRAGASLHHRPRVHRRRPVALVLGDNIFYGRRSSGMLLQGRPAANPALPSSPTRCAIRRPMASSSSTPAGRRSRSRKRRHALAWAVTGYFYDNSVVDIADPLASNSRRHRPRLRTW